MSHVIVGRRFHHAQQRHVGGLPPTSRRWGDRVATRMSQVVSHRPRVSTRTGGCPVLPSGCRPGLCRTRLACPRCRRWSTPGQRALACLGVRQARVRSQWQREPWLPACGPGPRSNGFVCRRRLRTIARGWRAPEVARSCDSPGRRPETSPRPPLHLLEPRDSHDEIGAHDNATARREACRR
jgi:hypothetical protein